MRMPDSHTAPQLLIANEWFRELPDGVVEQLAERATRQKLVDGELLYARGDPPMGFYGVNLGRIRLSTVAPDGRELLVVIHEPGNWFGEVTLFDGLDRLQDAHAHGDTELLFITRTAFHQWLAQYPELYPHFTKMLCRKLRMALSFAEDMVFLPLPARLAKRLIALADAYGRESGSGQEINLHLPQDDLARMLGATRQTVSRALKAWEASGIIRVAYGRITVCNAEMLRLEAGLG